MHESDPTVAPSPAEVDDGRARRRSWTPWLLLLLAAVLLILRGVLISDAHSEYWDDQYHITRGERFLWLDDRPILMNNPPLGEAIVAVPVTVSRVMFGTWAEASDAVRRDAGLRSHPLSPDAVLMWIAVWKSLLFLPLVWVMYRWGSDLYGRAGGLLAAALGLIDPTFAAHVPIAALDVLCATTVVLGSYATWKYAQQPTLGRLLGAGAAVALAMSVKHTALILPFVAALIILLYWRPRERASGNESSEAVVKRVCGGWRPRVHAIAALALLVAAFIWAFTLFDISEPRDFGRVFSVEYRDDYSFKGDTLNGSMMRPWPAGNYLGSVAESVNHGIDGHSTYLLGQTRTHGWWNYFPIVASYKVPIGIGIVLLLAIASLAWRHWRRDEWSVVIPTLAWTAFLMYSPMNLGFRLFLPAYAFMLIFAGHAVSTPALFPRIIAVVAVVSAAAHALAFHPEYVSYVNFPRDRVYLQISDSNIDWGQSLKQVARWLDEHPQAGPVRIGYFGERSGDAIRHYLGQRVEILDFTDAPPTDGTLILSAVWLAGGSDAGDAYAHLRDRQPDDVIGNSMLVYKLDNAQPESDSAGTNPNR